MANSPPMFDRLRMSWNIWLGRRGEDVAARFLRRRGLKIITTNVQTPHGELDLIARAGDTLVFVEVKTRGRGNPAEAVNFEKRRRITRSALYFLKRHKLLEVEVPYRFDIVAVVWPDTNSRPTIEHEQNAFEATGNSSMFG
jgi:putative endonuclease